MSLLADTIAVAHGWPRLEVNVVDSNFQNSKNIKNDLKVQDFVAKYLPANTQHKMCY